MHPRSIHCQCPRGKDFGKQKPDTTLRHFWSVPRKKDAQTHSIMEASRRKQSTFSEIMRRYLKRRFHFNARNIDNASVSLCYSKCKAERITIFWSCFGTWLEIHLSQHVRTVPGPMNWGCWKRLVSIYVSQLPYCCRAIGWHRFVSAIRNFGCKENPIPARCEPLLDPEYNALHFVKA